MGLDATLNKVASATGNVRPDPQRFVNAIDPFVAGSMGRMQQGVQEGGAAAGRIIRGLTGWQEAPAPAAVPAQATAQEKEKAVVNAANNVPSPPMMPQTTQEPGMMARPGFTVGEQPTTSARSPVQNYLDDLASQRAENAAIRAQALQDLQDASRLDTSSVGDMFVSGVKGRRKGMAAKAALGSVEAMDPNKFISPVVQQGMQSEASRYTADAGAAASRFTAQTSAAEKAQDRALKAGLEGPKAAQEAMLARMLAQAGGDLTKIGNVSSAFKGMGDTYQGVVDPNSGMISAVGTRGSQAGNVLVGGRQTQEAAQRAQGIAGEVASQKDQASQKAYVDALSQADKDLYFAYLNQDKKKK
jgi:hypothetical protein